MTEVPILLLEAMMLEDVLRTAEWINHLPFWKNCSNFWPQLLNRLLAYFHSQKVPVRQENLDSLLRQLHGRNFHDDKVLQEAIG